MRTFASGLSAAPADLHGDLAVRVTFCAVSSDREVNSASDGDTIVIPAGTCTWTSNLTITAKVLVLQGAGMDRTVIVDGVSKTDYPNIPQVLVYFTKPGGLT